MVLVAMPLGLLFFGGGGALVVADDYGFGDRSVQAGMAAGLAVNVVLGAVALTRRPLTGEELNRSHTAYRRVTGGGAILTFTAVGIVLAAILTRSAAGPFVITFCFALMTGASVLAGVLALARRGLHQRDGVTRDELVVWTHVVSARRPGGPLPPGSGAAGREPPGSGSTSREPPGAEEGR